MRSTKWLPDAVSKKFSYNFEDKLKEQLTQQLKYPSQYLKDDFKYYFHNMRWGFNLLYDNIAVINCRMS